MWKIKWSKREITFFSQTQSVNMLDNAYVLCAFEIPNIEKRHMFTGHLH